MYLFYIRIFNCDIHRDFCDYGKEAGNIVFTAHQQLK